jgi:hypothetical protein
MKVCDEGQSATIECPAHKCNVIVDDQLAMRFIKDKSVRERYEMLITKSFVQVTTCLL